MTTAGPVFWHEGLFLRPHHFQQQDLYYQDLWNSKLANLQAYPWGVSALQIQQGRLRNNVLEIESLKLVFRDGTLCQYPENALIPARSFAEAWPATEKRLGVYVGIRHLLKNDNNLCKADEDDRFVDNKFLLQKRFKQNQSSRQIADLYDEQSRESISFVSHNLQLFFGAEIEHAVDFELLKIAELIRSGAEVRLADDFIPPLLLLNASKTLERKVITIREQLLSRARELALYHQEKAQAAMTDSRDIQYLLALQALNRHIPLLYHYLDSGVVSPWQCYGLLRQMLGELSTFSYQWDLLGSPTDAKSQRNTELCYQHENLALCFDQILEVLLGIMDELTSGPDYVAALHYDGTYYNAELGDSVFKHAARYFIAVYSEQPEDFVVNTMQAMSKLASRELLPLLIARSLAGASLEFCQKPPASLPRKANCNYFELMPSGDSWGGIRESRNLAIYLDGDLGAVQFELMVIYV